MIFLIDLTVDNKSKHHIFLILGKVKRKIEHAHIKSLFKYDKNKGGFWSD